MSKKKTKLRPCPFCGRKGVIRKIQGSISQPERFIDPVSLLDKITFYALQKRFQSQEFEEDEYVDILTYDNVMRLCNELDSSDREPLGEYELLIDDTVASNLKGLNES